ncbi:GNAT family N-acetyltransferase [Companilactobacillus hulinensis]|uniref:GNAT family N-acetyltransferase n=1 Tax=Companilactobacillus hulinensis TaxID=2486007 RepID=UPI000F77685C|nr:GNAT family N-acetyltransferase [Companilactobacillus hulinensis]
MTEIRPVTEEDAQVLLGIYAPYVLDTAITFEYEVPTIEEFVSRIKSISKKYPYLVAEDAGKVVGYAYADTYNSRDAYNWTVEISIYVDSQFRGQGIGKMLYHELEQKLLQQKIVNILACITEQNTSSIRFHERMGYELVGTFKKVGFKFDTWYDIVWMQKKLVDQ